MISDSCWKLLEWLIYISLVATSVWFTWGVFDKFAKQETAIRQYEDKIEEHPTISICNLPIFLEYQKSFNITYTTYQSDGFSVEDEVVLTMGRNHLQNSGEFVNLTKIYTKYIYVCYAINTTRNVTERETEIKIWPLYTQNIMGVFFTSEKNSYGATRRDWRDGEVYSVKITNGIMMDVTLTVEKSINLKCNVESFYEYIASKLPKQDFEKCNNTCLMTSLPNDPIATCPNYNEWYIFGFNKSKEQELDCNWTIVRNLIQNITDNDEHLKTCVTTQYAGVSHERKSLDTEAQIKYNFALPLKAKVYEEYFIIDTIEFIGSVGGTLGVFIGFSFSNLIISIIENIQFPSERKLISRKKFTETIRKCLEWIFYLSLMITAILHAMEVIEKMFVQNTGIKQNMEKIELQPTVTICPFLEQCDTPMKLDLRLQAEAKKIENPAFYEGSYDIMSSDLINGKPYWTHKKHVYKALWYSENEFWVFGLIEDIGTDEGPLIGMGTLPYETNTTWYYLNNNYQWTNAFPDVVVEPG